MDQPKTVGKGEHIISAPAAGTFYAATEADQPPLAAPGTIVRRGEPLGIVEAMKIFTELKATSDYEVLEILASPGQRVQAGDPLFKVRDLE